MKKFDEDCNKRRRLFTRGATPIRGRLSRVLPRPLSTNEVCRAASSDLTKQFCGSPTRRRTETPFGARGGDPYSWPLGIQLIAFQVFRCRPTPSLRSLSQAAPHQLEVHVHGQARWREAP